MGYHDCPIEPSDITHGPADEPTKPCPQCDGEGKVICRVNDVGIPIDWEDCKACEGTGQVADDEPYEPQIDDVL